MECRLGIQRMYPDKTRFLSLLPSFPNCPSKPRGTRPFHSLDNGTAAPVSRTPYGSLGGPGLKVPGWRDRSGGVQAAGERLHGVCGKLGLQGAEKGVRKHGGGGRV